MFSKFNCNGSRALRAYGFVYCHGGKLMNRIIAGVLIMLAPCAALAQEASTAADQVPIEEYVPKVIIEGKWGTGPGEFGTASQFPLGHFENYEPSSLAVDSKGNIYILDFVNDRIQKFSKEGKYLASLSIEGLKGELAGYCDEDACYEEPPGPGQKIEEKVMGQVEVQGINIVIDSKDTLYYYLKRNKDGKEIGEVWEFKNDKLVKKQSQNPDAIEVPGKPRGVPLSKHPSINWERAEISKDALSGFNVAAKGKNRNLKIKLQNDETLPGRAIFDKKEGRWEIVVKKSGKLWNHYFDESGKLIKISEIVELSEHADGMGNYYYLDKDNDVFRVRKAELVRGHR